MHWSTRLFLCCLVGSLIYWPIEKLIYCWSVQSTNQSIHQSINQSIHQSIQSTKQFNPAKVIIHRQRISGAEHRYLVACKGATGVCYWASSASSMAGFTQIWDLVGWVDGGVIDMCYSIWAKLKRCEKGSIGQMFSSFMGVCLEGSQVNVSWSWILCSWSLGGLQISRRMFDVYWLVGRGNFPKMPHFLGSRWKTPHLVELFGMAKLPFFAHGILY